jgi:LacI family transcriptional regulator
VKQVHAWLRENQPDVIVGHNNHLVEWAEQAGFRVPQDMGVVHIATDDDVSEWAGVCSNRRQIGAAAAEWVINLVKERRYGVPKTAMDMVVRGSWQPGRTIRVPNWMGSTKFLSRA